MGGLTKQSPLGKWLAQSVVKEQAETPYAVPAAFLNWTQEELRDMSLKIEKTMSLHPKDSIGRFLPITEGAAKELESIEECLQMAKYSVLFYTDDHIEQYLRSNSERLISATRGDEKEDVEIGVDNKKKKKTGTQKKDLRKELHDQHLRQTLNTDAEESCLQLKDGDLQKVLKGSIMPAQRQSLQRNIIKV